MSTTQPASTTSLLVGDNDLRLVLFGLPSAGKSSLLAALDRLLRTSQPSAKDKLLPREGQPTCPPLAPDGVPATAGEVVPYFVRYEPEQADSRRNFVVFDCDSRAALDILQQKRSLVEDNPSGTLAYEMNEADAVLLVLDASRLNRIEDDFAEFGRFLVHMQASRSRRTEVGGLPVFLVLTKCDQLARRGDSHRQWLDRIEERKREVGERFKRFLASSTRPPDEQPNSEQAGEPLSVPAFGKITLHVWATATRRPPLNDLPTGSSKPYGVSELFGLALEAAADYRVRYERAQRRLVRMVFSATLLIGILLALAAALLVINSNTRLTLLQARVEDFRALDHGPPAVYLQGDVEQLTAKLERLQELRDDEYFAKLPRELRDFVEQRREEIKSYISYLQKMQSLRSLAEITTEAALDAALAQLNKQLALPRPEWAETPAGRLRQEQVETAEALREAVRRVRTRYRDASTEADRLWTFADFTSPQGGIRWTSWGERAEPLVDWEKRSPIREYDPVPGVPGGVLTYSTVLRYESVFDARLTWFQRRDRLEQVLNLTSALGLVPASLRRPAVLVFPDELSLSACKVRLEELRQAYPEYDTTFTRSGLPDLIQPFVRQKARVLYQILLPPARREVLHQFQQRGPGNEETQTSWQSVRLWLAKPVELDDWRLLARVIRKLDDPNLPDPVDELAEFLGKSSFTLNLRTLRLTIPVRTGLRPRAEARLLVHRPDNEKRPLLEFEPIGTAERDEEQGLDRYTFRLVEGEPITYKPGDKFWAELPLTGGKQRLVWSRSRSSLYQFERLANPPRVQDVTARSLDEGVPTRQPLLLTVTPEEGLPTVPGLLPEMAGRR